MNKKSGEGVHFDFQTAVPYSSYILFKYYGVMLRRLYDLDENQREPENEHSRDLWGNG